MTYLAFFRTYIERKQMNGELNVVNRTILSCNSVSIIAIGAEVEVGVGVEVNGKWTQFIQSGGFLYES
jgi:hypothetical protein